MASGLAWTNSPEIVMQSQMQTKVSWFFA